MTWFDAKDHCKSEGGKLVEIDSAEENIALVDEINKRKYNERKMHFWIGMTDLGSEGDWRLASNGLMPSFLNWAEGAPSNGPGTIGDCARLRTDSDGRMGTWDDDIWCKAWAWAWAWDDAFSLHALCEFDPPKEKSSTEEPPTTGTSTNHSHKFLVIA